MSFRRDGGKPPRPPPPKGASSKIGSGPISISFKSLEEEDDEDLTIFTGKFDKIVEDAQKSTQKTTHSRKGSPDPRLVRAGSASVPDTRLNKMHTVSKSLDEDNSSPTKKSFFEYKEIITGLKDKFSDTKEKITDTINKKLEEFSGDSSSNPSPENEHPDEGEIIPERVSVVGQAPERANVEGSLTPTSESEELKDPLTDSSKNVEELEEEEEDDDDMTVIDEYFNMDPTEDFNSMPGLSVSVKQRSKLKRLVKKNSKPTASATVSMSTLMGTVTPVDKEEVTITSDEQNNHQTSKSENQADSKISHKENITDSYKRKKPETLQVHKSSEKSVPLPKLISIGVCVFAFMIVPLPSYLSGLVMGVILASASWAVYIWFNQPPKQAQVFKLTPLEDLPPLDIPEMKDPVKDDGIYKGWMNELMEYNPDDYHISQTHSVFVSLEGTHLRLQRPKLGAPRRAMWDEVIAPSSFVHQRHFDLVGSRVFLMPPGLVKKRIWSKKYPVCIALSQVGMKFSSITPTSTESPKRASTPNSDGEMGFEIVDEEKCDSSILYFFARTGREKEDWYKRFACASMAKPLGNHLLNLKKALSDSAKHRRSSSDSSLKHKRQGSTDSLSSLSSQPDPPASPPPEHQSLMDVDLLSFAHYMGRLMPSASGSTKTSPTHGGKKEGAKDETTWSMISGSLICDKQLFWVNALIGRIFWDFLRDKWWSEKVNEKLQRKLSKIHVPYFIEELKVTHIEMGSEFPAIRRAGKPYMDERGFWVDLDVAYSGGFKMTIETKVNLMKLKKTSHQNISTKAQDQRSPITDSDEEDSAESSTDEEEEITAAEESSPSGGTASKKFLRYLDKITKSKYFQQATEYKYVKRAMEGVSNTPLILTVEVKSLVGTLALNIPPPPTDRFWYGFRGNPRLWLSAKPKVGVREVTLNYVTEWIEKKLSVEFQRVFVMPNMDDLVIPILLPGILPEALPAAVPSDTSSV